MIGQSLHGTFWHTGAVAMALLAAAPPAAPPLAAEVPVAMEQIVQAWQDRQQKTQTARFAWKQQLTRGPPASLDKKAKAKAAAVTVHHEAQLTLNGSMISYSRDHVGEPVPGEQQKYRSAFDGEQGQCFFLDKIPSATIRWKESPDKNLLSIRALLLACRPLDPALGQIDPAAFQVSPVRGVVGGQRCVILKETKNALLAHALWVCPEQNFAILRYVESVKGQESVRLDVTYAKDSRWGWLPSHWDGVWVNPESGRLVQSVVSDVTRSAINEPIPVEEFRIEYPPGTWVVDEIGGTEYIVREGGERRLILKSERELPYEELLVTETGMAGTLPLAGWERWLFRLVPAALVLAIAFWLLRRRRDRGRDNVERVGA